MQVPGQLFFLLELLPFMCSRDTEVDELSCKQLGQQYDNAEVDGVIGENAGQQTTHRWDK